MKYKTRKLIKLKNLQFDNFVFSPNFTISQFLFIIW